MQLPRGFRGGATQRRATERLARASATVLLLVAALLLIRSHHRMAGGRTIVLSNSNGVEVHVLPLGAIIQRLLLPDKRGGKVDVVLGFDEEEPYRDGTSPYFGALVGRVANRIANATFELDGKTYKLAANNGPNCLHGGKVGFDKREWTAEPLDPTTSTGGGGGGGISGGKGAGQAVRLSYHSRDGEEGFPGNVQVTVTYTLGEDNSLTTEMVATTDAPTPINLAQHSYFNLAGHDSGDILQHKLTLHEATHYTPVNVVQIPTGEIAPVNGTPFDFTSAHSVGERIADVPGKPPGGYDHNFVLHGLGPDAKAKVHHGQASATPRKAATLVDPFSGRGMRVLTTAPGVQFYSGNFLPSDGTALAGKGGAQYRQHGGLCLETQGFPDAINQPAFPSAVLRPGEQYRHVLVYQFFDAADD